MNSSSRERTRRVLPLKKLCQRVLLANIERIRHLGITPQFLVADVLAQCTPEQLSALEHHNPHIIEDNEPLWQSICLSKHADLQTRLENDTTGPVLSWRDLYWNMRRQDDVRAEEIRRRIREKVAVVERERSARKMQKTNIPVLEARSRGAAGRPGPQSKGMQLIQRARLAARANTDIMDGSGWQRAAMPGPGPKAGRPAAVPSRNASPAHSPPYGSHSPPYLSSTSASSCSPPHSTYSPPYVPEVSSGGGKGRQREYSPGFDIFEHLFGVSSNSTYAQTGETVAIREETVVRRGNPSSATKRKRNNSDIGDRQTK